MIRFAFLFAVGAALFMPSVVRAAPVIGSVTPFVATVGVSVNLSATVSSGVPIQSCTLWVDLAEIGPMNVTIGSATREYTFPNGGSRIAFVFCRDTQGGISAGPTTAINVTGATQTEAPLSIPSQSSSPSSPTSTPTEPDVTLSPALHIGELIKATCPAETDVNHPCRAVYYISKDGSRHAFPNSRVFFTWYADFDAVIEVPIETLSDYPLGTNVVYRGGVRMVKFTTDPKVYAVSRGGTLRWITSEELAKAYYGDAWNTHIDDIPDSFYADYTFGSAIEVVEDYNPEEELMNSRE